MIPVAVFKIESHLYEGGGGFWEEDCVVIRGHLTEKRELGRCEDGGY